MLIKPVDLIPHPLEAPRLIQAVTKTLQSGTFIGGSSVTAFEKAWADYCGAAHCISTGSGFDAIRAIIRASGWHRAHYPAMTCFPTPLAIEAGGAMPMAEINPPGSFILTSPPSRSVVVWLYGIIDGKMRRPASEIIEDAAQAHGSHYRALDRASKCLAAAWSFYPTKNLGALGDAGAITTNSADFAQELRKVLSLTHRQGFTSRLDSLQAEILLDRLPRLNILNDIRQENAQIYLDRLQGLPITLPNFEHTNWHQFPILAKDRPRLKAFLEIYGVQTLIHYPTPAILDPGKGGGHWPEQWAREVLSLPIAPHLSSYDLGLICDVIQKLYEKGN